MKNELVRYFTCSEGVRYAIVHEDIIDYTEMDGSNRSKVRGVPLSVEDASTVKDGDVTGVMFADYIEYPYDSEPTVWIIEADKINVERRYVDTTEKEALLALYESPTGAVMGWMFSDYNSDGSFSQGTLTGIEASEDCPFYTNGIGFKHAKRPKDFVTFKCDSESCNPQKESECNDGCGACYTVCDKDKLIEAIEGYFGVDLGPDTDFNDPVDLAINLLKNHKDKYGNC